MHLTEDSEPSASDTVPMPIPVTHPCVCSAVRRADRALNRLYDEALRPSGLATTQYALLSVLSRADRPLPHAELADRQEMAGTTLSRTVKPLVRDGLIALAPGEDRRTRYVAITPAGEAVLARARPLWASVQDRLIADVGQERVERLLGELGELVAYLKEDGPCTGQQVGDSRKRRE